MGNSDSEEGIHELLKITESKNGESLNVLNISELTFLAYEMKYTPIANSHHPLWFHKGVVVFDRELSFLKKNVLNRKYDVIIFQYIPILKDYFPHELNELIEKHYVKTIEFRAPWHIKKSKIFVYTLE